MERVKNYFKNYPESKECFETSDGLLFHVRHRATAHSQTLEDKGVKTYRRESVQDEQPKLKLSKKDQEAEKLAKEQAEKEAAAEAEKLAKEQAEKEAAAEAEKLAKEQAEKEAAEKAEAEKKGKK